MSAITKIEETYLKLFKIVLLLILTVALFAAIGLAIKGWIDSTSEPGPVRPALEAPSPSVDFEGFIKSLDQPQEPAAAPRRTPAPAAPQTPRIDPLDQMVDKYIDSTWVIYDAFQKRCMIENAMSREDFVGWPELRNFYRGNFDSFGESFARSQDGFIKATYPDPRVVEICIQKQGKGRMFAGGIEWHRTQWIDAVDAADDFNRKELRRVQSESGQQQMQAMATRAFGQQMLWAALISFGVFMSLALLLIFSKIETNLRAVRREYASNESVKTNS